MISKSGFSIIFLLLPLLTFAQDQSSAFRVFENGEKIQLPDSIHSHIQQNQSSTKDVLIRWLASDGFLNASIDSVENKQAFISRNCPFRLDEIQITYSGEVDSVVTESPNVRYSQNMLQLEIERVIFELASKGYPFARGTINRFMPDHENCSVSVALNVETGEKAEASEIYFSGLQTNEQEYLRRISRFQVGQVITPSYLRFLRANLNSSELFNFVGEGQVFLREGKPVIVYEVQERSLNQFDGLLGYVPDAAGNGQIMGDVELSLWNVLTQGNGLNFQYERLRPETSELNLGISQDWIADIPIGISAGFQFYQNDTTYQTRDVELGGYYRISGGFKLTGGIGFQASTSGGNVPVIIEPDGRKRTAQLGFEYSNLDNFDVPTSGSRIAVNYGIANKNLEEDSTGSFIQNSLYLQAQQYFSVFNQSVIAVSLHGFLLEADRVTINDLVRFGGANSFRGYAEDQFRAGELLWADLEYRFLLDQSSYLFAFGAAGRYHRPKLLTETNNDFQITNNLYSTGFGLSYQTRIGRLKFTYAISPDESIANGKVHFGIRTEL